MIIKFVGFCCIELMLVSLIYISLATDILITSKVMIDGMTLVSAGSKFEFGFFSPANLSKRYLGIWYYGISPQTIVWVANRNNPVNELSGVLKIDTDGTLILGDHTGRAVWSTDIQQKSSNGTVLQLLDSGNLVLRHGNDKNAERYIWQSFDHLTDNWLAGMKIGRDSRTGLIRNLTSWKSSDDPSPGEFTYGPNRAGHPLELVIWQGNSVQFRSGPWNGAGFSGFISTPILDIDLTLIVNKGEGYYEDLENNPIYSRTALSYSGEIHRYRWNNSSLEWLVVYRIPIDPCDNYDQCGANSICTINDPLICSCLPGYMPKSPQDWDINIRANGCVRKHPLNCSLKQGFIEVKHVKVPDHWLYWMNTAATLKECEEECLKNCSCTAYSNSNISGKGSGCLLWYGDLIDIRRLAPPTSQTLYIRVDAQDLESKKKKPVMLVVIPCSITLAVLVLACCIIQLKRAKKQGEGTKLESHSRATKDVELPTFELTSIAKATNNFSDSNKVGQGGFGPVYKGQIPTGQEIAVKRLSIDSNQGLIEFNNEVILISRLQHRNLVKLLGCCIQGEEQMLIYEYMPNKSLDNYIYDSTRRKSLAWTRRFDIITGIARGLLYLHRDSRLRIIHRDLKASNILLDNEMNPKISDFGIARAFGGEQSSEKTTRVIGTYGNMSPEYVVNGLYSMKSDVFSFGVLLLEIVSGRKNRDFHHPDHNQNLLGHAWKLWNARKTDKLIDELMEESFPILEVQKCIQVGLLCVQQCPQDRPTMSTVVLMLDSESTVLPSPKQPGFYTEMNANETEDLLGKQHPVTNDMTVTLMDGR